MKNEIVEQFAQLAEALAPLATERKKGNSWRALIFHLGDIFPEDRAELLTRFSHFREQEQKKGGEEATFKGTVQRPADRAKVMTAPKKCATCPDNGPAVAGEERAKSLTRTVSKKTSNKPGGKK